MHTNIRTTLLPSLLACSLLAVAACGSGSGSADEESTSGHHHDGSSRATPAYAVQGELRHGTFAKLPDASPQQAADMAGDAWVAENDKGTTVTIELTGLKPGGDYVGHLHAQRCHQDDGGPHFAFDPEGAESPPNEVHFGLEADHHARGSATVENPRQVGSDAKSVVVHDSTSEGRLVCADLEPASKAEIRAARGTAEQAPGDDNGAGEDPDAVTVEVQIRDGEVTPNGERVGANVGQPIVLEVSSDQSDHIHVHSSPGKEFSVKSAEDQQFRFTLERPGVYEVETHDTHTVIAQLEVRP